MLSRAGRKKMPAPPLSPTRGLTPAEREADRREAARVMDAAAAAAA
eukprot:COSAG06_NODE_49281_length_326_cov_1.118943_1_plen_45_part_01